MSCASGRAVDSGVVIAAAKIQGTDYRPRNSTLTGAGVGAGAGATIGAISGAAAGAALTMATFGLGAATIPAFAMNGALAGAAIGGVGGGGMGYAAGVQHQGLGLYQYTVRLDHSPRTIIITQYINQPIHVHAHVNVVLNNDKLMIKQ